MEIDTKRNTISLNNVTKSFIDHSKEESFTAVVDINLDAREHEFVALIGPSGCGKSTILNLIAGFIHPTKGEVMVNDKIVENPGAERCVVFQDDRLFPWLTVAENMCFGLKMARIPKKKQEEELAKHLDIVGLSQFRKHFPNQLSGGMKQRVSISRALINNPEVLLMDEPFAALDAQTRMDMQLWLMQVWENHPKTVLFVTHEIDEAIILADRIVVMGVNPGRIIEEVAVNLSRPRRTLEITLSEEYNNLKRNLLTLIKRKSKEET